MKKFIVGGGQQDGRRSGTENVGGIVSFAAAAELFKEKSAAFDPHVFRQYIIDALCAEFDFVKANGGNDNTGYILSLSFSGLRGQHILNELQLKGIYIGLGSACVSNKGYAAQYRVLSQFCKKVEAEGSIRISFSPENTMEEIAYVAAELAAAVRKLKGIING